MSEKDITEKILESYNDVFADIVNVLIYDGREIVKEEALEDRAVRSAYKADDKVREIERDVFKRWKNQNVRIACVGLENQTEPDKDMPLRVIAYDGAEYRAQLDGKERYPVITLVLYFGFDKHWDKPINLKSCINIPEGMDSYVNDYRINLFEIAYLPDETIKKFKSDFGIVADYFAQRRKYGRYRGSHQVLKHDQAIFQMMRALTGNSGFELKYAESVTGKEGKVTIDNWLTEELEGAKAEGRAEGKAEGRTEGKAEEKKNIIARMLTESLAYNVISRYTGASEEKIKEVEASMLTMV